MRAASALLQATSAVIRNLFRETDHHHQQLIEPLECRRMMAVFNGTPGNDTITTYVSGGLAHVVVNGIDNFTFDAELDIYGLGGNDIINIDAVPALTLASVNPGDDFNVIHVGGGDFDTNIQGNVDIVGTTGNDTVVIEDGADGSNDFDYCEFTNFTFRKPSSTSSTLSYFSVEAMTVMGSPQSEGVKIISTAAGTPLHWNSNTGNDTIYIADGDLGTIDGQITLSTGGGTDDIILYDYNVSGPITYDVYNSTVVREGFADFTFSGAERIALSASKGDDIINLRTGSGSIMTGIECNEGNDTINIQTSAYTVNAAQPPFSFNGYTGNDTINLNTQSGNYFYSVQPMLIQGSFLPDYNFGTFENVNINGGSGNEIYFIFGTRAGVNTVVNAGAGEDTIALGGAFGANFTLDDIDGPVSINGGGDADLLAMVDSQQTAPRSFTINDTTIARNNMAQVAYGQLERVEIYGGLAGDTFSALSTDPQTPIVVDGGTGLDNVIVNSDLGSPAEVHFDRTQDLAMLEISENGSVIVDPNGNTTIDTRAITLHPSSRLDLNDNAMILDYTQTGGSLLTSARNWLMTGRNGGAWNGTAGIMSTFAATHPGRAIGYAESSALFSTFPAIFAGRQVDSTAVLLRATLNGDTNLDRNVKTSDFTRLAANFGMTSKIWSEGDFNFDGNVNVADFTMLGGNFAAAFSGADAASSSTRLRDALPELR